MEREAAVAYKKNEIVRICHMNTVQKLQNHKQIGWFSNSRYCLV